MEILGPDSQIVANSGVERLAPRHLLIRTNFLTSDRDGLAPFDLLLGEAAGEDQVSRQSIEHVDELQVELIDQEVTEEKPSVDQTDPIQICEISELFFKC